MDPILGTSGSETIQQPLCSNSLTLAPIVMQQN